MERTLLTRIFFFGFFLFLFSTGFAEAQDCVSSSSVKWTNETCPGEKDGTATITVSGGTAPFGYILQKRVNGVSFTDYQVSEGPQDRVYKFTAIEPGSYRIQIYDANMACPGVNSENFIIGTEGTKPAPVSITGSTTVCEEQRGVIYEVAATEGSAYNWTVPADATIASGQGTHKIRVNFGSTSGDVAVVETNAGGCSGPKASLAVEVVLKPQKFTLSAVGATTFCEGEPGPELVLDGSEVGVTYYLYNTHDLNILKKVEGTGAPISFGNINAAGEYAANAYNTDSGCSAGGMIGEVTLTPITIALSAETTDVTCKGESTGAINLSVSGGIEPYSYSWSNGATSQDIDSLSAGDYTVTVTDDTGCTEIQTFTIVEPAEGMPPLTISGKKTVCEEQPGVMYEVSLTAGSNYSWTVPVGANIASGATGPENNRIFVNFGTSSGDISVVETNAGGCTGDPAKLAVSVVAKPAIFTLTANGATAICENEEGPELLLNGSETGVDYMLVKDTDTAVGTFAGTGSPLSFGRHNIAGDYRVLAMKSDLTGCNQLMDGMVTITVDSIPDKPSLAGDISLICQESDAPTISLNGENIRIYNNAALTSQVGSGNTFDPDTDPAFSTAQPDTVTYYATQQVGACTSDPLIFDVVIVAKPDATFAQNSLEVCQNESAQLEVNLSGSVPFDLSYEVDGVATTVTGITANPYFISFDNLQADLRVVLTHVADATGCAQVLSDTATIKVNPLPAATLTEDATICAGGSADLTFAFTGTAPFTVEYTDGSQTFIETSADTSLVVSVSPDTTTTYTVVSIADNYCSQPVSGQAVTITVNEAVAPAVEVTPASPSICEGEELTFTANSTNAGTSPTYQWYVNNLAVSGNNQATYAYVPQDGDSVFVLLTQGTLECGTGETVTSNVAGVSVEPTPDASFSGPATVCLAEVPLNYTPAIAGGTFTANIAGVISEAGEFNPTEAGPYTIYYSITSAAGCSATDSMSVQVNSIDSVSVNLAVDKKEACGETNEFVFTANITNGGDNPQIRWFVNEVEQTGQTAATFTATNFTVATHEVKVAVTQDAASMLCGNGTTVADSLQVRVYPTPVATLSTNNETAICAGDTINLLFEFQGTAPYELAYTNGTDTIFAGDITADSLFVEVQPTENQTYSIISFADASACTAVLSGEVAITVNTIPQEAPANLQATTIACSEISVGWDATANSEGYQIRWSEDSTFASGVERDTTTATTATITGLSGGATYYIEVTAFNGCGAATESGLTSITLPATSEAPATITISAESCDGFSVGWNSVTGAQSYELDLATDKAFENFVAGYNPFSTTDTTEVLSGLDPINYYLRLRTVDSCGISQNSGVIQVDLNRFVIDSLSAEVSHLSCAGDTTGSISVSVHGGVGPFSYLWSTGDTTNHIENQPAGSYWLEVNSTSGCSLRDTFEIREPLPILLKMAKEDVSCYGDSTGTASVSIQGGVEPYSISWSNGIVDTTHIYGLPAGQYFVEITDANSCVARDTVTILQPDSLQLSADIVHVNCPSDSTGSINLSVSGGTGGYRYVWHTLEVSEDQFMVEHLPAGSYPVTVYDSLNCSISDTLQINSANPAVVVNLGPDKCAVESTELDAGYDVADYAIAWSTGDTTQTITVTESGNYSVTVTKRTTTCAGNDAIDIRIGEPLPASVQINLQEEESCSGDEYIVVASTENAGPNPVYQWYLNADSVGVNSDTLRLLTYAAGDTIRVVVAPDTTSGCATAEEVSDSLIISLPWMEAPVIDAEQITVCSEETPAVTAVGDSIRWYLNVVSEATFLNKGESPVFSASGADTVYLLATQQLASCRQSRADTLELIIQAPVAQPLMPEDITRCGEDDLPEIIAEGENIRWYADAALTQFINEGNTLALTGLNVSETTSTDTTFYATQNLNGCTSPVDSVTITTYPTPVVDLGEDIARCSPAEVVLDAGFDAELYTISWSTKESGASIIVDISGTYTVTVTHNESGCFATDTVNVSIEDCSNTGGGGGNGGSVENCTAFSVELSGKIEPSCDRNNGYLQYSVTGGVSPYTINYSFAETNIRQVLSGNTVSIDIDQIPANEYITLSITDAQGKACSLDSLRLTMAPRVTATLTKEEGGDVSCFGEQMGKAKLEIAGGNAPFDYKLNEGEWVETSSRTVYFDALSAGTNSILVRSVNDRDFEGDVCYGEDEVEIQSNPKLAITSYETEDANCNDNTGKIWIREVTGGNGGPYRIKLQSEDSFREFNPEVAFEGLPRGEYRVVLSDGVCEIVSSPIQVGSPGLIALEKTSGVIPFSCEAPELRSSLFLEIDSDLTRVQGPFEADISILRNDNTYEQLFNALTFNGSGILRVNGLERGTYRVEVRSATGEGCPENREFIIGGSETPVPISFEAIARNIYCADDLGGVVIKDLNGADGVNFKVKVYNEAGEVALERNISSIRYASHRNDTLSGLSAGIFQMVISQDQQICDRLETSEPVVFEIKEKARMLQAEVVSKTESFPERGSGSLTLAVQTNSGQEPYLSSVYLVEPLFPGQTYFSENDTVKYDPIKSTFGLTYTQMPAGIYDIYVTDANGCSLTIQDTIAYDQDIFIPNLFTPNNDGYNDVFYVRNIPEKGTRLIVTNRWGKVVYQTQDYANDWDGGELPEGIYFYHLQVAGGEGLDMKGWLELRRGSRP